MVYAGEERRFARLRHIDCFQREYQMFQLPEDIQAKREAKEKLRDVHVQLATDGTLRWNCPRSCNDCYACTEIKAAEEKARPVIGTVTTWHNGVDMEQRDGFFKRIINRIFKTDRKVARTAAERSRILHRMGERIPT